MSKKRNDIFDLLIGFIPLFILICLQPSSIFVFILFIVYIMIFESKIKHIWGKYILKESDDNTEKKCISDLRISKTITRRAKDKGYETLDFKLKFDPNVRNFNLRLLAKIIDILFYYLLLYLMIKYYKDFNISLTITSIFLTFIISPIFETLTGRTLGKLLIGLQVVDDYCKHPSLKKSYAKNFLQLFNILFFLYSAGMFLVDDLYFHNKKTKTYTIYTKEKNSIIKMLNEQ